MASNRPLDQRRQRPAPEPRGADTATDPDSRPPSRRMAVRPAVVGWGLLVGVGTAATPAVFWWLPAATVHAVGIAVIAAIYLGFAVADGRAHVLVAETAVAGVFVLVAALAITGSPWLLVAGLAGHGAKDLWQHRTHFVTNTRWWPPFCAVVDWVAAILVAATLITDVSFR